jgi:ferredoxin
MDAITASIDETKCDGCGLCVNACQKGAIALTDGEALPTCPRGAIGSAEGDSPDSATHWPIKLESIPTVAEYYKGRLVIAGECTAFVTDDFKSRFVRGDALITMCMEREEDERGMYWVLNDIILENDFESIDVIMMDGCYCRALFGLIDGFVDDTIPVNKVYICEDGSVKQSGAERFHHKRQGIRVFRHTAAVSRCSACSDESLTIRRAFPVTCVHGV